MQQIFKRGSVCVSILDKKKEEEEEDPELDKTIAQLGIAEYQVKKVHRILAGILDRSNPVVFSKGSSTYTFEPVLRKNFLIYQDKEKIFWEPLRWIERVKALPM